MNEGLALATYEDWQHFGFQVQSGQKHVGRNFMGKPVFSSAQVKSREEMHKRMADKLREARSSIDDDYYR